MIISFSTSVTSTINIFVGVPLSEIKSKQSTQIRVLSKEEIEKMRVAGRVRYYIIQLLFVIVGNFPKIIH